MMDERLKGAIEQARINVAVHDKIYSQATGNSRDTPFGYAPIIKRDQLELLANAATERDTLAKQLARAKRIISDYTDSSQYAEALSEIERVKGGW